MKMVRVGEIWLVRSSWLVFVRVSEIKKLKVKLNLIKKS